MELEFDEILSLEDVKGVVVLSGEGQVLFQKFVETTFTPSQTESKDWQSFLSALEGIREADFLFDNLRIYVRQSSKGHLMVFMSHFASIAMVRLNCDILLAALKKTQTSKGFGRFFKRAK